MKTEWGSRVLLRETDLPIEEAARNQVRLALESKGVTDIRWERHRAVYPAPHMDWDFPYCPYAEFEADHPGADLDEYPECGQNDHWGRQFVGWELSATGVSDDD